MPQVCSASWAAVLTALILCTVVSPALARGLVVLVTPLPFGVDVYLNMTRLGTLAAARDIGAAVRIFESTDPETRS